MVQIGRFKFGFAVASTIVVFIALTVCAVVSGFHQYRPEYSAPLIDIIFVNEGMALLGTLVYGIFAHFIIAIIDKLKK